MGVVDAAEHEPSMDPRILESEYDGGGSSEMVAANWINYELKLAKFSVKKNFHVWALPKFQVQKH